MQYGITEVFVKHDYYSNLRVKLLRPVDGGYILLRDAGNALEPVGPYEPASKVYPAPAGFLSVSPDYPLFYVYENGEHSIQRYKYIVHRGTSRSSKTWTLCEWAVRECEQRPNLRINVWRDTRASLTDTVWKDFKKVFPLSGRRYKFPQNTVPIFFPNGSTIEPHGADTTNAHGNTQDIAWLNEPYLISKETFDQIDQRAELLILDMNPKMSHWSDAIAKHPRCKIIHSTFQRNPFCPPEQRRKLLSYDPGNPINIQNGTADAYMWSVYGLGEKAERPHRIYKWEEIPDRQYHELDVKEYTGVDWGIVDPFAIVRVKYFDGALYVHELNYLSETKLRDTLSPQQQRELHAQEQGIVLWLFERLQVPKNDLTVCDCNYPAKIDALNVARYRAFGASKPPGSIVSGISLLQSVKVYYTASSLNIAHEQESYSWATDRLGVLEVPEDTNNHTLDAIRYVAMYLAEARILRR